MMHLRPSAPIEPSAILTPDPAAAMQIATSLLPEPRMSNHAHGLWGYRGETPSGALTVQSLGIGGASAAIVLDELAGFGLERAVAIMPVRAVGPYIKGPAPIGWAAGGPAAPGDRSDAGWRAADPALTSALRRLIGSDPVRVCSTELPGDALPPHAAEADARDLGVAALLAAAARRRIAVGAIALVAEPHEWEESPLRHAAGAAMKALLPAGEDAGAEPQAQVQGSADPGERR